MESPDSQLSKEVFLLNFDIRKGSKSRFRSGTSDLGNSLKITNFVVFDVILLLKFMMFVSFDEILKSGMSKSRFRGLPDVEIKQKLAN